MQAIRKVTKRESTLPTVEVSDHNLTPPTMELMLAVMQIMTDKYADTKGWNWLRPHLRARQWPGEEVWGRLFGDLGFGVMLIAHGKNL